LAFRRKDSGLKDEYNNDIYKPLKVDMKFIFNGNKGAFPYSNYDPKMKTTYKFFYDNEGRN
jgi:hypothetical protein